MSNMAGSAGDQEFKQGGALDSRLVPPVNQNLGHPLRAKLGGRVIGVGWKQFIEDTPAGPAIRHIIAHPAGEDVYVPHAFPFPPGGLHDGEKIFNFLCDFCDGVQLLSFLDGYLFNRPLILAALYAAARASLELIREFEACENLGNEVFLRGREKFWADFHTLYDGLRHDGL